MDVTVLSVLVHCCLWLNMTHVCLPLGQHIGPVMTQTSALGTRHLYGEVNVILANLALCSMSNVIIVNHTAHLKKGLE